MGLDNCTEDERAAVAGSREPRVVVERTRTGAYSKNHGVHHDLRSSKGSRLEMALPNLDWKAQKSSMDEKRAIWRTTEVE